MLEQLGFAFMAALATAVPQPASVRLNLVAVVPVTCSSAVMLASQPTDRGIRINLGGSCNSDHLVRVTMPDFVAKNVQARLNGSAGIKESQSFLFQRPGYFSGSSVLDIDLDPDAEGAAAQPESLVFEISPV